MGERVHESNPKLILLVEDDVLMAASEKVILEKCGYNVITATTGEKAIKIVEKTPRIDLILMDIDLGNGIDGTEAAEIILKDHDIPVVFLSNHTETGIVEKSEKITSYGYVVKNSAKTVLDVSIKMAFKLFEANRKIRESEIKQKSMISNISDVIGIIGADGIIKYLSSNIEKRTGWLPQDLVGYDCWRTVHPDDMARNQKDFFDLLKNDNSSITAEFRLRHKDGNYSLIEATATNLVKDPVINGILLNYHDITEYRQAEEAIKKSEEKFAKAFNASPEATTIASMKDGRYIDVNEVFLNLTGYKKEEVIGCTSTELGVWVDHNERMQYVEELSRKGFLKNFETRYRMRNNKIRNFVVSSEIIDLEGEKCSLNFILDITDRKKAENEILKKNEELEALNEKLAASIGKMEATNESLIVASEELRIKEKDLLREQKFIEAIFESIPGHLYVYDDTLNLVRWNKRHETMTGYSAEELSKMKLTQWYEGEDLKRVTDALEAGMVTGYGEVEAHLRTKDGRRPLMYLNGVRVDIDGKQYFTGIGLDITERKRIEDALAQEVFFMKALMEHVPEHIYFKDRESRFIRVNNAQAQKLGFSDPMELVGKTDFDFFTEENARTKYEDEQMVIRTGQTIRKEENAIWTDGAEVWLLTTKMPLLDINGNIIGTFGISEDITERKEVEAALAYQQFLMSSMMENITDYIYFKDRESRFIRISKSLADKYGISNPREAIGKTDYDFFDEESACQKYEDEQEIIRTGRPINKEERESMAGRKDLWVSTTKMPLLDINGNIIGTFGISKDIAGRKQVEEALQLKTMLLEAILNSSVDGIMVMDSQSKKILQNQRAIDVWKIPKDISDNTDHEVQIQHDVDMIKNPKQYVEKVLHLINNPDEVCRDEIELTDGTFLERYSSPVMGANGQNYGRVWMFHDVTGRKQSEDKIKALLAEKELLLREVHHRIKNNMNTLNSLLELQALEVKEPSAVKVLENASHRVLSMMVLYDRLYQAADFSSMSVKNYIPYLVDGILSNFPNSASVKVIKNIDDFILDAKKLQPLGIIINELITNTMKYAFVGRSDGLITLSILLKGRSVSLVISDNGEGIPESIDFESTTSFGLTLVKMMSMQLDGMIRLEQGEGTKFILEFEV